MPQHRIPQYLIISYKHAEVFFLSLIHIQRRAVECGYWHLWRYNPQLAEEGKNPFSLDSKEPQWDKFQDFLDGEVRYLSVKKAYPTEAEELFAEAKKMAQVRYKSYLRKAAENWDE